MVRCRQKIPSRRGRNATRATVHWRFTLTDARTKLHRLYPAWSLWHRTSGAAGTDGTLTRPDEGAYSGPAAPSRRVPSVGI